MAEGFNLRRAKTKSPLILFDNGLLSPLLGNRRLILYGDGYYISGGALVCVQSGSNYESFTGYFGFDNPISTKGYKYIHFEASSDAYAYANRLGLSSDNTKSFSTGRSLDTESRHVVTVPISEYQGNYYVIFSLFGYGSPETGALTNLMRIYRIWLDNSESGE